MDVNTYHILARGMEQLQAEEQLLSMDAVSYPHSDQKHRRKSHKKWMKQAYPENFEERTLKTTDLELF